MLPIYNTYIPTENIYPANTKIEYSWDKKIVLQLSNHFLIIDIHSGEMEKINLPGCAFNGRTNFVLTKSEIITISQDSTGIVIYDLQTKTSYFYVQTKKPIYCVGVSNDGNYIAVGDDQSIKIYNRKTKNEFAFATRGIVNSLSFSKNKKWIAYSDASTYIYIYNLQSKKLYKNFQSAGNEIKTISFSPDDKILAAGSYDGRIYTFNTQLAQKLEVVNAQTHVNSIDFVDHSPYTVVAGGSDGAIRIYKLKLTT
jgi:WD40 repeat protein